MTTIRREARVPHSAHQMFQLVDNIEAYPDFLPWCHFSEVHRRNPEEVEATLGVQHGFLKKTFTTNNRLQQNKIIQMKLVKGPFKHFEGYWRFESLGGKDSRISLDMQFEFSAPMLSFTLGPVFSQIGRTLVDAFCKRADAIYG